MQQQNCDHGLELPAEQQDYENDEACPLLLPAGQQHYDSFAPRQLPPEPPPRSVLVCVCVSHALARWAWRSWEFAVALILMRLHPSSLLLVSLYGLLDNLARVVLGSFVGGYVDRWAGCMHCLCCCAYWLCTCAH